MLVLGAVLMVVGALLVLVEAHVPTGGVVGVAAIAAMVTGVALLLLAAGTAAIVTLVVSLLLATGAFAALFAGWRRLLGDRRLRPRTGAEALVGHVGVVRRATEPEARVFVDGALWRAESDWQDEDTALHEGDRVVVQRVHGLTLCVRKAEEWELVR
jgi:membrane-bound serine protease (ClpP class)